MLTIKDIIETSKILGISAREYISRCLKEVSLGRADRQNLTHAKLCQQY